MNFKSIYILLAAVLTTGNAFGKVTRSNHVDVVLPTHAEVSQSYGNLQYGIRLEVRSNVEESEIINLQELPSSQAKQFPSVSFENTVKESVEQYLGSAMQGMGLKRGSDFVVRVNVKDFRLVVRDYNPKRNVFSASGTAVLTWELLDADHQVIISANTLTGHASTRDGSKLFAPLSKALTDAMNGIDWDAIASKLKVAKNAREQVNAQVEGKGTTALEHTVIRWYIDSKPKGADVSWRVVSSTPDVANTNANYVGTTPYETTEAFDIKGLTYNNSGNVQIEVTCERNGYLEQKKRFNLRQVIDQKEISAKFNLVKEDDE